MLDPKFIEKNLDLVREKILQRGVDFDFEKLISIDERRRRTISETQKLEHQKNQGSKKFGELKRNGKDNEASELQSELRSITEKIKIQNERVNELEFELREILLEIPNLSDESVPIGSGEKDNVEIRKWGTPTEFNFEHKDHVEIGTLLGILDLGRLPVPIKQSLRATKGGSTSSYMCSLTCISNIKFISALSSLAPSPLYNENRDPEILDALPRSNIPRRVPIST